MTQNQLDWMQQNGLDPSEYDMTPDGRVLPRQPLVQEAPQKEVMSMPRAFGTSFLGSLAPSAASLAGGVAGAELGALGGPFAPATVPLGAIIGSLGAGYLGGKGQQAALERFAPEAIAEMQRAETDQPVASYLGGFAPAALTFKPSLKGVEGLSAPLMRGRDTFTKFDPATISRFTPAAVNVGVNAASAGAGQLVNMSEGGEFSAPRFAADVALGSLFSDPNKLGRKMGFPSLTPQRGPVERMDLAGENARRAGVTDEAASERATELLGKEPSRSGPMFGPDARKFDIYENQKAVTEAFDKLGIEKNPETIQDFVNDPMLSNFRDDPAAVLDYVSEKTGLKAQKESAAFETEYAGKPTEFAAKPTEQPIDPRRASVAENRKAIEEVLTKMKAAPPEEFMQDLANDPVIGNLRDDPQAFQDFIGQKAEKYLEKSWQTSMDDINRISKNLEEGFGKEEVAEFDRAQARREEAKNIGIKDIQPARDAAEEIHQRFQRPVEEGPARITQEDLDAASEIAAMRGLKITFADLGGGRGKFQLQTPDGIPLISIDPSVATRDTAIHEIGHDVYSRSVGEGMRKGLVATAEDSPVYKAEYEARINARDEQGNPTHTEAQARDIALEEGLIQAFGEAYPNVKSGAIRQWFNAIKASMKDLVGMKLSPEDASAYLYYLTNENVPWKGVATAKTGDIGGVGGEEDIRYQRGPVVGQAKEMAQETLNRVSKFAELDNLESRGGIHAVVAKAMKAFYATRSFMEGRPQAFEKAMYELSPERRMMLGKHIGQEFDQQRFIKPTSEIAAAYNEYRQQWQKFWPDEANKAGHTIRSAGGQRARLTDPYYGPFHIWNDNVRDIMTNKQGSPEYVKLQDDYIKQHVQAHQQNGIPLQEAQTRAAAEFSEEIRALSVPYDPTAAGTFAGARKAQGIPLPDSWREYDIVKLIKSYDRRSAIDFAMQEHMERSPEVMAALGSKTFFNDQPIPAQIKAVIPDISTDKSVQSILREMSGQPATKPDSVGAGASRGISALTIGTVSKATEIPTTMIAGLRYLQASDYLPGTMKFIEKLADWSALQERSYASGLNKRDASQNMRQVSGVAENAAGFLNKFAEGVSSVTGLNKLEQAARTLAQGWGEVLVQINKNKAATGDKDAVRMLDTFSPDWRTRSDADLAAQFGKLMQGSYDMTQLPAWMLESGAAPYLTWSKWSAGQYSNFVKFAIEPAMQGNVKPLIGQMLIGVMGGAAVDQIREWMNNREGRDVNWNELESWMQQNQGQLGAEGMKQLSVKLLNIMQGVGTFGIAGDLAKMVTTAAVGGTAQGMATAPVANAVFDTSKKVAAALKAIDDGEDFGLVLRQAMGDVAKTHVQVARVWNNWTDKQENLRYDDRRQRRLFDELTGAPTQAGTFSVNYGNLAEREFERGDITEKTGEEAFSLVSRARQEATSGEDYASRIRKLKTSQNQIMPSLERQPMKAARYLSFVEGAEPGKGSETLKRYYTRQNEDKYRKSLIEGMSGIR